MNTPRILRSSIAAVVALLFDAHPVSAATATWLTAGTTGVWNDVANWTPATIPNGPADIATFGVTDQFIPFVILTANTEVNGIVFSPGAPGYSIGSSNVALTISGAGITNNSASVKSVGAGGPTGIVRFEGTATAGDSNVAILAQNGGTVFFAGSSNGGAARLGIGSNGVIDISGLTTPGMTAGFIVTDDVGANFFRLGSKTLTVGGMNASTTVFGAISDGGVAGGTGGSIVKVGTGTMTYAGSAPNTYTGTTFVNEGTLELNKPFQVNAIRGPLVIGDGVGGGNTGTALLRALGVFNIEDNQPVTVNEDGIFELVGSDYIGFLTTNKGSVYLSQGSVLTVGPLVMNGGGIGGPGALSLFGTTVQASSDSGGNVPAITTPVHMPANASFTFTVNDGPGATDLLLAGDVTDGPFTASIVKTGGGVMVVSGSNSYNGSTTIKGGTLRISSDANLGTPPALPAANHLVFDGGTLQTTTGFSLNGNRGITLNGSGGTVETAAGSLTYSGIVAGEGSLSKTGPATLVFAGDSENTHTGATAVNDGFVFLVRSSINKTILGPLTIGDGVGPADSAVVITDSHQISDTAPVTIRPDGKLNINETAGEAIGSLVVAGGNLGMFSDSNLSVMGPLAMTGGAIFGGTTTLLGDVTAASGASGLSASISSRVSLDGATRTFAVNKGSGTVDLNLSGVVSNGGITKTGAGTLALTGANTYIGPTTIIEGKLILSGSISGSATVVANGATLQGTGTTGSLTINTGASLIPGLSVGTLTTGNLMLAAGSTISFELAVANVVGSGVNDLVHVNGNLTLDGTLRVTELTGFGDGTYPLFDYSGTLTNNGLDLEASFLAAHPGSSVVIDTVNTRVNLAVIPEPGTPFLALAGGATLLLRHRQAGPRVRRHLVP